LTGVHQNAPPILGDGRITLTLTSPARAFAGAVALILGI
jgi:hypothetical protein